MKHTAGADPELSRGRHPPSIVLIHKQSLFHPIQPFFYEKNTNINHYCWFNICQLQWNIVHDLVHHVGVFPKCFTRFSDKNNTCNGGLHIDPISCFRDVSYFMNILPLKENSTESPILPQKNKCLRDLSWLQQVDMPSLFKVSMWRSYFSRILLHNVFFTLNL